MRRTPRREVHTPIPMGIIPADAGNTCRPPFRPVSAWDHPRGCGEHPAPPNKADGTTGSSPRMRGTPMSPRVGSWIERIIPADAGNTKGRTAGCRTRPDHPRGCGEHMMRRSGVSLIRGSSPRMRGTPGLAGVVNPYDRIIPADAGNTNGRRVATSRCPDHPRGCGEHKLAAGLTTTALGSSPRIRGTLDGHNQFGDGTGIIPADAGNTSGSCNTRTCPADHPRGCGEHPVYLK